MQFRDAPAIKTMQGWLVIYHGVRVSCAGCIYRLGLFELKKPDVCLKHGDEWIFGPMITCEQHGDVGNVVFPCGTTIAPDGDTVRIYLGAADSSIALATGSIREMLEWLELHR